MNRVLVGLVLLFSSSGLAQEYRGTILGRITDPSGAVVAGASVAAKDLETGVVTRSTSNEAGNYQIPFLVPGQYAVTVECTGFKRLERKNVPVLTNEPTTVDLALELGPTTESMTVTAEVPLLNTTNADLGQVVDKSYIGMVSPSLDRNIINIKDLAPGVIGADGTYTSSAQSTFSINGGGGNSTGVETIVDGMPNTTTSGTMGFVPSVDQVEEVKVHTTMFDASYGHSNGGAISIVTKGGTNDPHGTVFLYKRWAALNANSFFNNKNGLPKATTDYHEWGFNGGGPVYVPKLYNGRNRTFFTFSLERDNDPRLLAGGGRVPTDLERKGNFSQTIASVGGPLTIYDPASTAVSGTKVTRTPFAGNIIPATQLSPIGTAFFSKLPEPTNGLTQLGALNWNFSSIYTVQQRLWNARIDHSLNDKNRISGRVGFLDRLQVPTLPFPGLNSYTASTTNLNLNTIDRGRPMASIDDTMTLSPSLVGSVRFSYVSYTSSSTQGAYGANPSDLNLPGVIVGNQSVRGYPVFNLGENLVSLGSTQSYSREEVFSLISTWTKLKGNHSIKFGADERINRVNNSSPGSNAFGNFTISPKFTQSDPTTNSTANTSGTAMATLLLGLADSGNFGSNSATSIKDSYSGLFVQDDWKISQRLTVNLGVRYELETPFHERYNRQSLRFDPTAQLPVTVPGYSLTGGILFAGVNGNPRTPPADKNNFGPRFGFAYNLAPKTVVRGGFGIFYAPVAVDTSQAFGSIGAFNSVTPFVGSTDSYETPSATLANPFPNGLTPPVGSSVGLMAQVGNTFAALDSNRVSPYAEQWQTSIQRELPSQIVAELAYTGMHSVKELESYSNYNEIPDSLLALGAAGSVSVKNPFYGIFPATSTLGTSGTIAQNKLWAPYPQFSGITMAGVPTGMTIYHAGQAKVEKRLTHGLNFLSSYTFSKAIQNNTSSLRNVRHWRAVSPLDQKQSFNFAFTYTMPFQFKGRGVHWLENQLFGGWAVSGLMTKGTGMPLSVTQANGRPYRIANPSLSGRVDKRLGDGGFDAKGHLTNAYFNTYAFQALPSQYVIASDGPYLDDLRAPGTFGLSASLFKSFPIREHLKLQVRFDSMGLTNTPNFGAPGTNMSQLATFGQINSSSGQRTIQGSARLTF
ncbi:MAG TPA: TonB-dependent receptor [Bryobacteraceae bacterium]|nr:TonB-dependent receptor [Bryobacteraceae bacterium]